MLMTWLACAAALAAAAVVTFIVQHRKHSRARVSQRDPPQLEPGDRA